MYFTEIPDRLKYNSKYQAQLSVLHADMIDAISKIYVGTASQKTKILQSLNYISYRLYVDGSIPSDWSIQKPLENIYYIDDSKMKAVLGPTFISPSSIKWNLEPVAIPTVVQETSDTKPPIEVPTTIKNITNFGTLSTLGDISLFGPEIPQLDVNKIWKKSTIDGTVYCIYHSLPEIPTRQCEISLTTDIRILSDMDFIKLYPNTILKPRDESMYNEHNNITLDPTLGAIFKIDDFSLEDVVRNIIEYPQVSTLCRLGRSSGIEKFVLFGKYIEIDGELKLTSSVWDELSDTCYLPKTVAFMQEYVVRRYILERDIKNIKHKYSPFGTFDKHLSLILPTDKYQEYGYTDLVGVAKQCVESRISYIQSRNPVIRRIENNG